ncbi:hypothetical protein GQ44DRAFT_767448 [Phaeosphaeriaceae sp. PMI808]|nr:hypothetical protein GQ44DRAFT_767448 [Phaeosphaeriaceae sp. PMI808]
MATIESESSRPTPRKRSFADFDEPDHSSPEPSTKKRLRVDNEQAAKTTQQLSGAASNSVSILIRKDNSNIQVGNNYTYYQTKDYCLRDLRSTNPRDDKKRIEKTKGGLLKDSYRWILDNADFQQ